MQRHPRKNREALLRLALEVERRNFRQLAALNALLDAIDTTDPLRSMVQSTHARAEMLGCRIVLITSELTLRP